MKNVTAVTLMAKHASPLIFSAAISSAEAAAYLIQAHALKRIKQVIVAMESRTVMRFVIKMIGVLLLNALISLLSGEVFLIVLIQLAILTPVTAFPRTALFLLIIAQIIRRMVLKLIKIAEEQFAILVLMERIVLLKRTANRIIAETASALQQVVMILSRTA